MLKPLASFVALLLARAAMAADGPAPEAPPLPDLRTLFHSAAEREQLDRLRRGEPPEQAASPAQPRKAPVVTGFVRRSDGRDTVWLDGHPVSGAEAKRMAESARAQGAASPGIEIKRTR